ncbi:SDR family NAD(P)-dependent oxidoreductase [Streptomyces sp. CA-210063]|uniref:SDR family NAD(P)-dependent oxidoreductase n=1 Tax=Streptomyces sp. CA-210063 TaxID=2801029 RepID=UPI00214A95DA|nr:SDR family NAD(P)-dependent oxidoreductase [Streptomyces sp. CA-210063]UUU34673.1 SDR family NAD(P)-dependent oxidoreductase [Streptomyces sp. CA-210063]
MEEQSLASFRRVLDVNLQGPWPGMRAVAPSLRRAGGGVIVNISSLAGPTSYVSGLAGQPTVVTSDD